MLVLTRKVGQRIRVGDGVFVVIQRIQGKRVVLGFEAPRCVAIVRDEVSPVNHCTDEADSVSSHSVE